MEILEKEKLRKKTKRQSEDNNTSKKSQKTADTNTPKTKWGVLEDNYLLKSSSFKDMGSSSED